jgi:hypothetical protein
MQIPAPDCGSMCRAMQPTLNAGKSSNLASRRYSRPRYDRASPPDAALARWKECRPLIWADGPRSGLFYGAYEHLILSFTITRNG